MKKLLLLLMIAGFGACNNQPSVPKNILPPPQMQSILWDVIRTDMMVNYQQARDTSLNRFVKSIQLYQQIFALHHTTKEQFKQSLQYYQTHPQMLQTILDSLYSQSSRTNNNTKPTDNIKPNL